MANGFKALRHAGGGVARLSQYPIDAATGAIYSGDLVMTDASGEIVAATTGNGLGSFQGCMYVNAKGEQKFSPNWPADTTATDITGLINEDKNVTYAVVASAGTVAVKATGALVAGTGNTKTGMSGSSVDLSGSGDVVVVSILDAATNLVEVKLV